LLQYQSCFDKIIMGMNAGLRKRPVLAISLIITTTFSLLIPSNALLPEQAGKYDWIKHHIGEVSQAKLSEPYIFVASRSGVVAALDTTSGAIAWRVVLDETDRVQQLEISGGVVFILTSAGYVRAFDATSGRLLWDMYLPVHRGCPSEAAAISVRSLSSANTKEKGALYIANCGKLTAHGLKSGHQLATMLTGTSESDVVVVGLLASQGRITLATTSSEDASTVKLTVFDAATGNKISDATSTEKLLVKKGSVSVLDSTAVALSADGRRLCVLGAPDAQEGGAMRCAAIESLLPSSGDDVASPILVQGTCPASFTLRTAAGTAVLRVTADKASPLERVASLPGAIASGCYGGKVATASMAELKKSILVSVVSAADGVEAVIGATTDASLFRSTYDGRTLGVASVFVGNDGKALVQLQEGTLALMRKGADTAAWTRHEALASVSGVLFADLPASTPENEAAWEAAQPSRMERLKFEWLALKSQAGFARPEEKEALERHRALTSDRLRPTRDPDGFRKQIIVATGVGKIASLHTGDGHPLWEVDFGPQTVSMQLALWKTPHDVHQDERIVAFRRVAAANGHSLVASIVNTRKGSIESDEILLDGSDEAAEIVPLPTLAHDGAADQVVYLIVSGRKVVATSPRSPAAEAASAAQLPHLVRWRVSEDGSSVIGTGFDTDGVEHEVWRVAAAPKDSNLRILSVAARDAKEVVYSAARPVYGGAIMLKHINPNTLLVVAGPRREEAHLAAGSSAKASSTIVATLIDAASGRVLMTQSHADATGPVTAVASEHWVAYHFWSIANDRWQIASIDAYRPVPSDLSTADLALGRHSYAVESLNATDLSSLYFERQSFFTRLAAVALGVTQTAHGTAAKMLLLATPGGQVYQLDRRLLDPRRPLVAAGTKPTPAQAAEALPAYQPELLVAGTAFATLDKRVARLRKVLTVPAVLESSTLMIAVGLDIFYARLQPSRGFDMVPDDFPRALLVAVVGGMGIALIIMRAVMQKRALKLKWA
jgi:ER membrane protein complex subunit 1